MEDIKLSVSVITYNQENYISQTIDSILCQKVNFKYELIIGDDCSTDGTRNILKEYEAKYPQIKLILHKEKNKGVPGKENFLSTINAARGKYIALLDGDDYWTDPLKLQKQVDFLEANPNFAICFHRVKIVYDDNSQEPKLSNENLKEVLDFEDLALKNHIYTPSCVFRNGLFKEFPEWFHQSPIGDWILHLLNAQHGKVKFLTDVMAVYRVHQGGVWSVQTNEYRTVRWKKVVENCRDFFYPRGKEQFAKQLSRSNIDLCFLCFEQKDYIKFRQMYWDYVFNTRPLLKIPLISLTMRFLSSYVPLLASMYHRR